MRILVTGAAGYIGSVVTELLLEEGHNVIALDSLRHGHRGAVHPDARFIELDLLDGDDLRAVLESDQSDAVIHMAAEALIDESLRDPGRFFRVNVAGGLNLLDAMVASGTKRLVFSSTAAVYGEPKKLPVSERGPTRPVNAYGESKLAFERILPWYRAAHGVQFVALRYFSACGATLRYGEHHVPETHIIPAALEAASSQRPFFLFGTDYDTPDGTCIRDYVHVRDIARAHVLALRSTHRTGHATYNLGNGTGYSNAHLIQVVREVTGLDVDVRVSARRPGDPSRLVANADRIRRELDWSPAVTGLHAMVESAWAWRLAHPGGYA
jgi:UDP-glucose 4-epimerase